MNTDVNKQSEGEFRVRTSFNPSNENIIDQIKQKSAELIDLVNSINPKNDEREGKSLGRLKSLSMTSFEEGAMWAVKAATH